MRYPRTRVGEVAKVKGGKRLPKGEKLVTAETPHPYIRARDIRDGAITFDDPVYVTEEIVEKIRRYTVKTNDVCITIVGANVGDVGIVPPFLSGANLTENAVKLTDLCADCDPAFLMYSLLDENAQAQMKLFAAGAAQPKLGIYKVNAVEIPFPPLPTQRKIAAILSAYDDLIENNARRIAVLEEMAQVVYREWFVRFRFPGREQVAMVDSELGPIPEGWDLVSFTDIAQVLSGGTPRTKVVAYWDGPIPFFSPRDIKSSCYVMETERSITELGLSNCSSDLYPRDTVFITARGTVGNVVMPAVPMAMNQTCYALRGRDGIDQFFVFLSIRSQVERLRQRAHGAVFDTIITDTFRRLKVARPPLPLIRQLRDFTAPVFDQILNLLKMNANLRCTRDLLLPRLVSCEVDVSDLDIDGG